ncbi:MAG: mechanosensitive ion channel family protein [Chloroflexi bacterium]|nr:mechanosensitive ion channel family protein [Chloroflexota bacterium]
MLATDTILARDIFLAVAIALSMSLFAGIFYYILRRVARRMAAKTGTALDNMLVEALEWPGLAGIILAGIYFAVVYLPFKESYDFEIRRGLHVAFIVLAAYGGTALVDSILRWFKLEGTSRAHTALGDGIVIVLRALTPLLAGLLALLASLGLFGIQAEGVRHWLLADGTRIGLILFLSVAALFALGMAVPAAIRSFVATQVSGQPEEEVRKRVNTLTAVLLTAGQVFIIGIATFIILSELGINIAPVLAGAGVAGIALGFGAQSVVKDIIAGVFIVMENQYRVGDVVKIADIAGLVEEINLRRTVLRDLDGIVHVVPNGEIRVASNFTKEWSRVNLNISVAYGTDLDRAIAVINRVCQEMAAEAEWSPVILKTPQVLRVDNLGDSGIELKVLGDTKPIRQWDVMGEIRKRVKKAFDEEGIEIPWPHTKVFFGNSPFPGTTQEGRKES